MFQRYALETGTYLYINTETKGYVGETDKHYLRLNLAKIQMLILARFKNQEFCCNF
jgi:hypothetical protein